MRERRPFDAKRAFVGVAALVAILVIAALWQRTHPYSIAISADIDATPAEVLAVLAEGSGQRLDDALGWEDHTGVVGILDAEHRFTLVELDDGGTRLTQTALFRGIVVPFTSGSLRDDNAPDMIETNDAIRDLAESTAETTAG
jgi:hypothetical protein